MTIRPARITASPCLAALSNGLLARAGWRCAGTPPIRGGWVAIGAPHTSNWDFVVGILAKWAIGIPVTFWGKDSLFRVPLFGPWLRWLGGVPVDRKNASGIVGQMADALTQARAEGRFLWLALAPEGKRQEEAEIGGIKGSHPINGGYHPWQYPNWATKFYADALMMDSANRNGSRYGLTGDASAS